MKKLIYFEKNYEKKKWRWKNRKNKKNNKKYIYIWKYGSWVLKIKIKTTIFLKIFIWLKVFLIFYLKKIILILYESTGCLISFELTWTCNESANKSNLKFFSNLIQTFYLKTKNIQILTKSDTLFSHYKI